MTSTLAPEERNGTEEQSISGRATTIVADVDADVHTTATDPSAMVADNVPPARTTSRGTVERVFGTLRGSSTGSLALGTVFAAGLSGGPVPVTGSPPARGACLPDHPAPGRHAPGAWEHRWWGAVSRDAHLTPPTRLITR